MKARVRLGIDIGGTQVKMALVDGRGEIRNLLRVDTVADPAALARAVRSAAAPWLARGVQGTGVGVAGDVDPARGVVRFAPNLKWRNVPLAAHFRRAGFPGPVHFENDANAAAWGAFHLELGRRVKNLVVLTLGTGVGGGLVLDGRLYRGAAGMAGELGHMTIEAEGDLCGCGNRGCLEAYVGGAGLTRWARRAYARRGRAVPADLDPELLTRRARAGDPVARAAWRRASRALGVGLSNLLNIFNPDTVLLTGGVSRGASLFLPAALTEMRARAFPTSLRAARVRVARRGADLGVAGAALLAGA